MKPMQLQRRFDILICLDGPVSRGLNLCRRGGGGTLFSHPQTNAVFSHTPACYNNACAAKHSWQKSQERCQIVGVIF